MVKIKHTPTDTDPNSYTVIGDSVDEMVSECVKRIRSQSQEYYTAELQSDLNKRGESLIDRHAGMGNFYKVVII